LAIPKLYGRIPVVSGRLALEVVQLAGLQIGDIVEVDRFGRRFHALVTGNASSGLSLQPLDRRISYRRC
jgi:hypothetical protein